MKVPTNGRSSVDRTMFRAIGVFVVFLAVLVGGAFFLAQEPAPFDKGSDFKAAVYDLSDVSPRVEQVRKRPLKEKEIRVRMGFGTINPADWKMLHIASLGLSRCRPKTGEYCGIGLDGAGVVEETGSAVTRVKVEDRVVVDGRNVLSQFHICDENNVAKIPKQAPMKSTAALVNVATTSAVALIDKVIAFWFYVDFCLDLLCCFSVRSTLTKLKLFLSLALEVILGKLDFNSLED